MAWPCRHRQGLAQARGQRLDQPRDRILSSQHGSLAGTVRRGRARPLGHRKRPALGAGRDDERGSEQKPQGQWAAELGPATPLGAQRLQARSLHGFDEGQTQAGRVERPIPGPPPHPATSGANAIALVPLPFPVRSPQPRRSVTAQARVLTHLQETPNRCRVHAAGGPSGPDPWRGEDLLQGLAGCIH